MCLYLYFTQRESVCVCAPALVGLKAAIRRTLSACCMSCRLKAGGCNMKYVGDNEAACKHCTQVTKTTRGTTGVKNKGTGPLDIQNVST